MIHELVHLYAPALTAIDHVTVETYDVQKAVNLNAAASLRNANNYALYAAGKLSRNGLGLENGGADEVVAVYAGCTQFPTMSKSGHDGSELRS